MKKSELKNGAVVELREGSHHLKIDDALIALDSYLFGEMKELKDYNDDLLATNDDTCRYDIMKVENPDSEEINWPLLHFKNDEMYHWNWERKEKFNEKLIDARPSKAFIDFLKALYPSWKWIAKSKHGDVNLFEGYPVYDDGWWTINEKIDCNEFWNIHELVGTKELAFLKKEKPMNIQELIEEYDDGNTKD